jgi:hypothetical protein
MERFRAVALDGADRIGSNGLYGDGERQTCSTAIWSETRPVTGTLGQ